MQVQLISQFFFEGREQFKKSSLKFRWDQIVMVAGGSFSFVVEGEEKPRIVRENEIVFIPAGTSITRSIREPMTSYHISFITQADHPFHLALQLGKLKLPPEQIASVFQSMKRVALMPHNQELLEHIVEHILVEHYLFGKSNRVSCRPLSEEVLGTIRYMNKHLSEKIDMDELAARVYLSHTGLIWKFRQELNTTPSKYLILLRLRYAPPRLHDYRGCGNVRIHQPILFYKRLSPIHGKKPDRFPKILFGAGKRTITKAEYNPCRTRLRFFQDSARR